MWSKFKAVIRRSLRFDETKQEIAAHPRPNEIDRVMAQPTLIKGPLSPCIGMLCDKDIISWMKCCSTYYKTFLIDIPLTKHLLALFEESKRRRRYISLSPDCNLSATYDLEHPPAALGHIKHLLFHQQSKISDARFADFVAHTNALEHVSICSSHTFHQIVDCFNHRDSNLWPKLKSLTIWAEQCPMTWLFGYRKYPDLHPFQLQFPHLFSLSPWQTLIL